MYQITDVFHHFKSLQCNTAVTATSKAGMSNSFYPLILRGAGPVCQCEEV